MSRWTVDLNDELWFSLKFLNSLARNVNRVRIMIIFSFSYKNGYELIPKSCNQQFSKCASRKNRARLARCGCRFNVRKDLLCKRYAVVSGKTEKMQKTAMSSPLWLPELQVSSVCTINQMKIADEYRKPSLHVKYKKMAWKAWAVVFLWIFLSYFNI